MHKLHKSQTKLCITFKFNMASLKFFISQSRDICSGVASLDNWGVHIHIFVFTDHKKQLISKVINNAAHEYEYSPPPQLSSWLRRWTYVCLYSVFIFNSFSYCIHKHTVNVKYSQINSFSLLFVKSPDFLSLEEKISRFFTLRLAGLQSKTVNLYIYIYCKTVLTLIVNIS
jgi:hypothetical protein